MPKGPIGRKRVQRKIVKRKPAKLSAAGSNALATIKEGIKFQQDWIKHYKSSKAGSLERAPLELMLRTEPKIPSLQRLPTAERALLQKELTKLNQLKGQMQKLRLEREKKRKIK